MPYLMLFLFFGVPLAAIMFFAVSLVRYCAARKLDRKKPGSIDPQTRKQRKILLIVSAVIAGVLMAADVAVVVLFYMAIAYM